MPWTIPWRADVDPAAGGHLAVHHEPLAIELVEHLPVRPFGHEVRVGDEHSRRVLVGAEDADGLARLDEQGLVLLEPLQRLDNLVEALPVARGAADAAIDDEALRVLGDLIVEVVHQHPHRGFGGPALALISLSAPRADVAAVVASVDVHERALSGWSGATQGDASRRSRRAESRRGRRPPRCRRR